MENAEERTPQIQQEVAPERDFAPIPMELSAETKKKLQGRSVWATTDLYIDRPVADGGYGSYAADGREFLGVDASVVKSLIRHYATTNKGSVWQMIAPVKVTLCGTDEAPLRVVLN